MSSVIQARLMIGSGGGTNPTSPTCVADPYYSCGPTCDPYWANVVLQLHGDGTDGSTTATDSSTYARVATVTGTAQISTTDPKFGTGSLYNVDTSQKYFRFPFAVSMAAGEALTVEFWFKPSTIIDSQSRNILSTDYDTAGGWYIYQSFQGLTVKIGSTSLSTGNILVADTWTHIAVAKDSNGTQVFVNGVRVNGDASTGSVGSFTYLDVMGGELIWGYSTSASGYIDDLRITKGVARYTGNFNIPTEAFPDCLETDWSPTDPRTVLSLHAELVAYTPPSKVYWRFRNSISGYFGTLEIEFRQIATGDTGISQTNTGGTPLSGGDYDRGGESLVKGNAFNGTFSGSRWSSDALVNSGDAWIGYQFAAPVQIYEIAISSSGQSGQDFLDNCFVEVSDDGVTWDTLGTIYIADASLSTTQFNTFDLEFAVDSSCYQPKTVALTGSATVSTAEKKYGASSFYVPNTGGSTLNGTSILDHQDFDFGVDDFTIELWAYRNANTYAGYLYYLTMGGEFSFVVGTDGLIDITYRSSGGQQQALNADTFPLTQWNFVVVQRRGTNFETYLNGTLINATAITGGAASTVNASGTHYLGRTNTSAATTWNGYIDEVRVTKGVARYDTGLPPTEQFPDSSPADPYWADVVLQAHFNGTNGGTTFTDSSTYARAATVVGTASLSTANTKYGTAAGSFDGTGGHITFADSPELRLDTGNFTIECWVKITNKSNNKVIINKAAGTSYYPYQLWYEQSNDTFRFRAFSTGLIQIFDLLDIVGTKALNTYYHLAAVRDGDLFSFFVNGVLQASATSSATLYSSADTVSVGAYNSSTFGLDGYIDDLRITKGIARYPLAFDPAALKNCDSTETDDVIPVSGTEFPQGQVITVGQGSISVLNASAQLSGQAITVGQGGLAIAGTPVPAGTNATFTIFQSTVGTTGTYSYSFVIAFVSTGLGVYTYSLPTGGTNSFTWITPTGAGASDIYELNISVDSDPFSATVTPTGFSLGSWFAVEDITSGFATFTTTSAIPYSGNGTTLQNIAFRIQVRPKPTSGYTGPAYERDYVISVNYALQIVGF